MFGWCLVFSLFFPFAFTTFSTQTVSLLSLFFLALAFDVFFCCCCCFCVFYFHSFDSRVSFLAVGNVVVGAPCFFPLLFVFHTLLLRVCIIICCNVRAVDCALFVVLFVYFAHDLVFCLCLLVLPLLTAITQLIALAPRRQMLFVFFLFGRVPTALPQCSYVVFRVCFLFLCPALIMLPFAVLCGATLHVVAGRGQALA